MTDNEKAATFIGWKPNDPLWQPGRHELYRNLMKLAPDMSRPENYMRALEVVVKAGRKIVLSERSIGVCEPNDDKPTWGIRDVELGDGLRRILVTIYNQEHAND